MLHINNAFALGDIVAQKVAEDDRGMVVAISINLNGSVSYLVTWGTGDTSHFAQELVLKEGVEVEDGD